MKVSIRLTFKAPLLTFMADRLPVISIVPVGLNYFAPHKFRSTVSVDFGDPIQVCTTALTLLAKM